MDANRVVLIGRTGSHARRKALSAELMMEDIRPLLPYFTPLGGSSSINIFSPPPEELLTTRVASAQLQSGDSYIVEDLVNEDGVGTRRLVFTSNLRAVQSEMKILGRKNGTPVLDHSILLFSVHMFMAGTLLLAPPPTSPSILVLGLGGGCLPSFFVSQLPAARVRAVDLDPAVIDVARRYFDLPTQVEVEVADGIQYVETLQGPVDYVFVDIDEKDRSGNASFPPIQFLEV